MYLTIPPRLVRGETKFDLQPVAYCRGLVAVVLDPVVADGEGLVSLLKPVEWN